MAECFYATAGAKAGTRKASLAFANKFLALILVSGSFYEVPDSLDSNVI